MQSLTGNLFFGQWRNGNEDVLVGQLLEEPVEVFVPGNTKYGKFVRIMVRTDATPEFRSLTK